MKEYVKISLKEYENLKRYKDSYEKQDVLVTSVSYIGSRKMSIGFLSKDEAQSELYEDLKKSSQKNEVLSRENEVLSRENEVLKERMDKFKKSFIYKLFCAKK